jgi:hypothetical protein
VLLCVKTLKACIRHVIEKKLSCKLSKRMYYYTRNHFYQCFMQFYIILIHKFVVSRSFKIRFCSDLSNYRPFGLLTFGPLTLRTNELTHPVYNVHVPKTWSNKTQGDVSNNFSDQTVLFVQSNPR